MQRSRMGFGDKSLLFKIVLILLIICFVLDLTGFIVSSWDSKVPPFVLDQNGTMIGIFGENRNDIKQEVFDWYPAIRAVVAFSVLSWYFFLHAPLVVIIFMFFSSDKVMYLVALCWNFAGAFFALLASAVYTRYSSRVLTEYSPSLIWTIISCILGFITLFLGMLDYLEVVGGK